MADFGMGAESLEAITRTDQLLDLIADQQRVRPTDRGEAELFALLEGWRDGVRRPPMHTVITEDEAAAALRDAMAAKPEKKGSRRGLALVGSIAAAVLAIGGFGAIVGTAQPGDSLYGLRAALFGEPQSVRDDRVTLAAQTEMAEVQRMIDQGDWDQAQQKLQAVSTAVQSVDNVDTKAGLIQQWNELSVKVGTRDPNATLPPPAPGEPAAPPPPGVTLLEVPAVTDTTSASATSTTSETPATTSSGTSIETTTAPTTATTATTETTETSATPTTSPTPATSATPTTSPTPATSATPTTSEAPGVSATTSAVPSTSAPAATAPATTSAVTQAPAVSTPATTASPEPAVTSSSVAAAVAPQTTTEAVVPQSTTEAVAPSTTVAVAPSSTTVVLSESAPAPSAPVTTTTTVEMAPTTLESATVPSAGIGNGGIVPVRPNIPNIPNIPNMPNLPHQVNQLPGFG